MRREDGLFAVEAVEPKWTHRAASVDKTFRALDPRQALLVPPPLDLWLPEDHLARFVVALVDPCGPPVDNPA